MTHDLEAALREAREEMRLKCEQAVADQRFKHHHAEYALCAAADAIVALKEDAALPDAAGEASGSTSLQNAQTSPAPSEAPNEAWICKVKAQGTTGGNDPADCDWPQCGCDPAANRVLSSIDEQGFVIVPRIDRKKDSACFQSDNPETCLLAQACGCTASGEASESTKCKICEGTGKAFNAIDTEWSACLSCGGTGVLRARPTPNPAGLSKKSREIFNGDAYETAPSEVPNVKPTETQALIAAAWLKSRARIAELENTVADMMVVNEAMAKERDLAKHHWKRAQAAYDELAKTIRETKP